MRNSFGIRLGAAVAGGVVLVSVAGVAAAEELQGEDDLQVTVEVTPTVPEGSLTMSVDGTEAVLTEVDSADPDVRQFDGALPTVTVTDTRLPEEIPSGAFWYVLGSSTDFIGDEGQDPIGAGHLGWAPAVTDPEGEGTVSPGGQVDTVLDEGPNNVGLVDQELLALAESSAEAIGAWQAEADLFLKIPATAEPGTYASTLTLSLFE